MVNKVKTGISAKARKYKKLPKSRVEEPITILDRLKLLRTGPESLYRKEYCERAISIMEAGGGRVEVAGALDVHKQTLQAWEEAFPEFKEALLCGQVKEEVHWKKIGVAGINDPENFNNRSYEFNMINRFPGWRMKDLAAPPTIINMQDNSLLEEIKANARATLGDKK